MTDILNMVNGDYPLCNICNSQKKTVVSQKHTIVHILVLKLISEVCTNCFITSRVDMAHLMEVMVD